jgi:SAM-dependent methyltransferase
MIDLLYDEGASGRQAALMNWARTAGIHNILAPDYHRLQVEHWVWSNRGKLGRYVMDVGQSETPRRWVGDGYFTLGFSESDIGGDLLSLPLQSGSLDGVILTEVLEHCAEPFQAVREVHRVLKQGGTLLVTSPFVWPWHGCGAYEDYWRFTDQGWALLLQEFATVKITPCDWTEEGALFYDQLRRWECFGSAEDTKASTGYLVEATK